MQLKVLVIEDYGNNMRLIEQLLEDIDENMQIFKAETGEKALAIAKEGTFDLVLTDIALPDMDGMQIAKILNTYSHFENTPLIAVTAYAGLEDKDTFKEFFDDYISKPIDEELFEEKIRKWIGDKLS